MAKQTITTEELILKVVETADENGIIQKPYVGVYGRLLKDRVRYKADPIDFIETTAKALTGRDIRIFTLNNQVEYFKFELDRLGLVENIDGKLYVDGRKMLGESSSKTSIDVVRARTLYNQMIEYSKSKKISIDEVFALCGVEYKRIRTENNKYTTSSVVGIIAKYADENGNVDSLKKDRRVIHNIRDWLINSGYETNNQDVVAVLSNFMMDHCPQYFFTKTLVKIEDSIHTYLYRKLKKLYPNGVINQLKIKHPELYNTLIRIKREMPDSEYITLKEFVETIYPDFVYETDVTMTTNRVTEKEVVQYLEFIYGAPNQSVDYQDRPLITNLSTDERAYSNVYRIACNKMMSVKEYVEGLGYRYTDLKQKFDTIKHHLIYLPTDEVYKNLGKEIPEGMARYFEKINKFKDKDVTYMGDEDN